LNQFIDLGALLGGVAAGDRAFDALAEMLLKDCAFDLAERGADSLKLRQDVDAIPAFGHHSGNSAHLSLDSVQAADKLWIMMCHSQSYIPSWGILQYTLAGYIPHNLEAQ
jgi:hypothetical protein